VVLLVLGIVWAVLLVSWLRSRTDGTFSDSVGAFRRHLSVLERAAPSTVTPANRLRSGPIGGRGPALYRPPARSAVPGRAYPSRSTGAAPFGAAPFAGGRRPISPAVRRRHQAQKRRRDVFFALLAGVVGTFLVALIPGLSVMWGVQVVADVVFVGYIALLVRMRNLAAERELKLTFIPQQARAARARPAYDLGRDYGELSLRRAAN
jgi:hypothetical protein